LPSEVPINGSASHYARSLAIGTGDDWPTFDRVMLIAGNLPEAGSIPPLIDPAADHLDPEIARRRADVDEKHRRVLGFLNDRDLDGALLTRADSIAWLTAGGDVARDLGSEGASVALFINATTRAILADNVQSARVFEEELAGLGFQLKERPWHHDPCRIIAELTHNKRVACDAHLPGLSFEHEALKALRRPLTKLERTNLRALASTLTQAVEATCRNFLPGETEADVAGQLAHRLIREGVVPVELRVAGDDRLARYRRPGFKAAKIRHKATISATGRRQGLCASLSRTVAFGKVDDEFRQCYTVASMVDATCIYFSRPGEVVSEIFRRSRRIFEKFEHPHEWTLDYQGDLIGYAPRELTLRPDSSMPLPDGTALRWSPSVREARSEDTVFIDSRGFEILTKCLDWPKLEVSVKGFAIDRPSILER
jgi:Xaa-Pro dipeptidase